MTFFISHDTEQGKRSAIINIDHLKYIIRYDNHVKAIFNNDVHLHFACLSDDDANELMSKIYSKTLEVNY